MDLGELLFGSGMKLGGKLGGKPRGRVGTPCPYCGVTMTKARGEWTNHWTNATRDHIRPRRYKGNNRANNRIIVCKRCNADKGDRFLSTWLHELRESGDPRADLVGQVLSFVKQELGEQPRPSV